MRTYDWDKADRSIYDDCLFSSLFYFVEKSWQEIIEWWDVIGKCVIEMWLCNNEKEGFSPHACLEDVRMNEYMKYHRLLIIFFLNN